MRRVRGAHAARQARGGYGRRDNLRVRGNAHDVPGTVLAGHAAACRLGRDFAGVWGRPRIGRCRAQRRRRRLACECARRHGVPELWRLAEPDGREPAGDAVHLLSDERVSAGRSVANPPSGEDGASVEHRVRSGQVGYGRDPRRPARRRRLRCALLPLRRRGGRSMRVVPPTRVRRLLDPHRGLCARLGNLLGLRRPEGHEAHGRMAWPLARARRDSRRSRGPDVILGRLVG